MERVMSQPREGWEKIVEGQGFYYHTTDEGPYWDETAYYRFSRAEIDLVEKATYALNEMCLAAVEHVIQQGRWEEFGIAPQYRDWIAASWETEELTIVGRFDLAFDGSRPPKMLEYNADTPTSLLEAAVVQWYWLQDCHKNMDQFNSLHERLIEAWGKAKETVGENTVHFAAMAGVLEDFMTVNYLRDTAMQAGLNTAYLDVEKIGWNATRGAFVDPSENPLLHCFKLYPWEWMMSDEFGAHLPQQTTQWWEPAWKVLLSNKAILAVLWELYPDHENLLEARLEEMKGSFVRKPRQGREGANVMVVRNGQTVLEMPGTYEGPWVYQRWCERRAFAGNYPVLGSWMVNGYACGMGIREDESLVTGNTSRFVPHVFS